MRRQVNEAVQSRHVSLSHQVAYKSWNTAMLFIYKADYLSKLLDLCFEQYIGVVTCESASNIFLTIERRASI